MARSVRILIGLLTVLSTTSALGTAYAASDKPFVKSTTPDKEAKPAVVKAETDKEVPYADKLLGSMWGFRDSLAARGIELLLEYKVDMFAITSGGLKRGNNILDNLDLRFDIDNEKLLGLEGNTAAIHFTNNAGGKPNAKQVGSFMGIDNFETTKNAAILYELWDQQSFLNDKASFRLGIFDLNNEFMVTESSLNFINPVMQMGQTLAESGVNGPSTFPYTTLGARLKYAPTEETYVQTAIFNASSGDAQHLYGNTHFQFDKGAMIIAETGFTPKVDGVEGKPNILALGGWFYTQKSDDQFIVDANGDPVRQHNFGLYALSSYLFYHDQDDRGLNVFFRPSMADNDIKQAEYAYEVGIQGTKWVPGRDDSEFGVAFAQAINSDKYRDAQTAASTATNRSEYLFDVYYRDQVIPGLTLQPDFQYIVNPASVPTRKNAVVFGLRTDINF